jgi:PTS system N-acetylglucosamine-specific IIA component
MHAFAATLLVGAPVSGNAIPLGAVPDPVFSQSMVGPGAAVDPDRRPTTAVSPIAGTLSRVRPHAFVVTDGHGRGVLVHLGLDTVELDGTGFEQLVAEGDRVEAGTPVIHWDPAGVEAAGISPVCPVIALDAPPSAVAAVALGRIETGVALFHWHGLGL